MIKKNVMLKNHKLIIALIESESIETKICGTSFPAPKLSSSFYKIAEASILKTAFTKWKQIFQILLELFRNVFHRWYEYRR